MVKHFQVESQLRYDILILQYTHFATVLWHTGDINNVLYMIWYSNDI